MASRTVPPLAENPYKIDLRDIPRGRRVCPLRARAGLLVLLVPVAACGVKGPPSPPAPRRPGPVDSISVRQEGEALVVRFTPPTRREDGRPLDPPVRFDVLAEIAGKGASTTQAGSAGASPARGGKPTTAELSRFDKSASIVKSMSATDLTPPDSPGRETAERMPVAEGTGAGKGMPGRGARGTLEVRLLPADFPNIRLAASRVTLGVAVVDGRGRRALPGDMATIEPVPPLPAPSGLAATATAAGVKLTWVAPTLAHEGETTPAGPAGLNLYRWPADEPESREPFQRLTSDTTEYLDAEAPLGRRLRYAVRLGADGGPPPRESVPAGPVEIDYRDTFPPSAPTGLAVLPDTTGMRLFWDPVTAPDLAGYRVWRAQGAAVNEGTTAPAVRGDGGIDDAATIGVPSDAFRLLTPEPIRDTTYHDTDVTAGVLYFYRVTALDGATPPNESAPSETVGETPAPFRDEGSSEARVPALSGGVDR